MNANFFKHPGTILREDGLGLFTPSSFLPVHFHWTTTPVMCHSLKKPLLSFDLLTPSWHLRGSSQALKAIFGQWIAEPFFVGLLNQY